MSTIEEVLQQERSKTSFNVEKMSQFLWGPQQLIEFRKWMDKGPPIAHDFNLFNRGRLAIVLQAIRNMPTLFNSLQWKNKNEVIYTYLASIYQMPAGVHVVMFTFYIDMMGTDSQRQQFMKKCINWEIIGCYAQTQLGHGSDVQNLETTAIYNQKNDTFTINSPTISAAKYWPGQLGLMSTWALVFAQLIVKGVKHGVHGFLVPIRDKDHNPLPGIQVGDIGPKIGFTSKDNGYLLLHNVVIPKRNMLRRYVSVSKTGTIKKKGDPKVGYATMMSIRQHLSCASPKVYGLAIITAARYSCFRKQFKTENNLEQPVIQYQTQQNKILTRVAQYYALMIGANNISKITDDNFKNVKQHDNFSLMNQTHACLCLGKAFYTDTAYNGMQICRKACGGHGFSTYSSFPIIINQYAANLTMQGQNSIMYLQVARYVMKCYKYYLTGKNKIGSSAAYINSFDYLMGLNIQKKQSPIKWNIQNIRMLLAQSVCGLIGKITTKIMTKPQGMPDSQVTNYMAGINLCQLGMLHSAYYTYNNFKQAVEKQKNQKCKQVLTAVCILYGIEQINRFVHALIEGEFISPQGISDLNQFKEKIYRFLRPELIGLVDAFAIPEKFLTNGLVKGNPYENYLKLARQCDVNKKRSQSGILVAKGIQKSLALHPPRASL